MLNRKIKEYYGHLYQSPDVKEEKHFAEWCDDPAFSGVKFEKEPKDIYTEFSQQRIWYYEENPIEACKTECFSATKFSHETAAVESLAQESDDTPSFSSSCIIPYPKSEMEALKRTFNKFDIMDFHMFGSSKFWGKHEWWKNEPVERDLLFPIGPAESASSGGLHHHRGHVEEHIGRTYVKPHEYLPAYYGQYVDDVFQKLIHLELDDIPSFDEWLVHHHPHVEVVEPLDPHAMLRHWHAEHHKDMDPMRFHDYVADTHDPTLGPLARWNLRYYVADPHSYSTCKSCGKAAQESDARCRFCQSDRIQSTLASRSLLWKKRKMTGDPQEKSLTTKEMDTAMKYNEGRRNWERDAVKNYREHPTIKERAKRFKEKLLHSKASIARTEPPAHASSSWIPENWIPYASDCLHKARSGHVHEIRSYFDWLEEHNLPTNVTKKKDGNPVLHWCLVTPHYGLNLDNLVKSIKLGGGKKKDPDQKKRRLAQTIKTTVINEWKARPTVVQLLNDVIAPGLTRGQISYKTAKQVLKALDAKLYKIVVPGMDPLIGRSVDAKSPIQIQLDETIENAKAIRMEEPLKSSIVNFLEHVREQYKHEYTQSQEDEMKAFISLMRMFTLVSEKKPEGEEKEAPTGVMVPYTGPSSRPLLADMEQYTKSALALAADRKLAKVESFESFLRGKYASAQIPTGKIDPDTGFTNWYANEDKSHRTAESFLNSEACFSVLSEASIIGSTSPAQWFQELELQESAIPADLLAISGGVYKRGLRKQDYAPMLRSIGNLSDVSLPRWDPSEEREVIGVLVNLYTNTYISNNPFSAVCTAWAFCSDYRDFWDRHLHRYATLYPDNVSSVETIQAHARSVMKTPKSIADAFESFLTNKDWKTNHENLLNAIALIAYACMDEGHMNTVLKVGKINVEPCIAFQSMQNAEGILRDIESCIRESPVVIPGSRLSSWRTYAEYREGIFKVLDACFSEPLNINDMTMVYQYRNSSVVISTSILMKYESDPFLKKFTIEEIKSLVICMNFIVYPQDWFSFDMEK